MNRITLSFILLLFSSFGFAEALTGKVEVLLDNEFVQVVRLTYPVGTESGQHTHIHPNRVVYAVKGGTLEIIPADEGEPRNRVDVPDGAALFVPASTHNVRNAGNTEIVLVETEIK